MRSRLYVGNLSYKTTTEGLRGHFEAIGDVSEARVATEAASGRGLGFAIVTMRTSEDARYAIERLDGSTLDGNPLAVRYADRHGDD